MNLMIANRGALGDSGYGVPSLNVLRQDYDTIFMSSDRESCRSALENTGLVDSFIIKPKEFIKWSPDYKRHWLLDRMPDFQHRCNFRPGAFLWHERELKFHAKKAVRVNYSKGKNYFDELARRVQISDGVGIVRDGVPQAYGQRPVTKLTHKERSWLRDFRYSYNIPRNAFLLGWQFHGSSLIKHYPFFDQVIQKSIMTRYPEVYVLGLGDLEESFAWSADLHGGRYVNLMGSVTFRQAYILTSLLDLFISPETGVYVFSQAYPDVPKILLASHTDGSHITLGDETVILQADHLPCQPCYRVVGDCFHERETGAALCMALIKPERIIAEIEKVIGKWKEERVWKGIVAI